MLILITLSTSCDEEEEMVNNNPGNPNDPGQPTETNPNDATASLIFDDMEVISGSPPAVGSITSDLKIDTDTIFWTEGIIKRVMIQKPVDVSLSGFWVWVEGADSYIEAAFEKDEETEEITVIYVDFDPSGWDLPATFPVTIVPFDEDGNALDEIETEVKIEKPYDASGPCNFDYGISDSDGSVWWEWIASYDPSIDFFAAPMFPFPVFGTTMGCCVNGVSSQNPNCPDGSWVELNYMNFYTIAREAFFLDGSNASFNGISIEFTQNFDPGESDFCTKRPGYNDDFKYGLFEGNWEIDANCHLNFEYTQRDNFVYVGSTFKPLSDHFIEEIRPGGLRRFYERQTMAVDEAHTGPWFD